jgi:ribosomal protein S18 acetylase RimI-like enzyme
VPAAGEPGASPAQAEPDIGFRPIGEGDMAFLRALYASTRAQEMALVDWSEDEKAAFLAMQFEAQHRYYTATFPDARFELILDGGEPIGRLYVDRRDDEIRIIDIALTPERRGGGIGTALMGGLLDEAGAAGKPLRIHVEHNNPALRLYRRLGFTEIEDHGAHRLMEWRPEGAGDATA